jgi:osmoprotectant transport system ATP-binding protein
MPRSEQFWPAQAIPTMLDLSSRSGTFTICDVASSIELREVSLVVDGPVDVLRRVNLKIAAGESVAFIGRSGAGKTTSLRLINGLATPTSGEVIIDGVPMSGTDLIALRRRTGYIIQGSGLFPHRSVFDNVAVIPRLLGWSDERIREAATPLMLKLGLPLERFGERKPRSLSGGEQQRVGIARALVAGPSLLLCDEPFGALDPIVRKELQDEFLQFRSGVTLVFVTHDLREALRVAGRIVLFDNGQVVADESSERFPSLDLPLVRAFVEASGR